MRDLDTFWGRDFEVELNDIAVREFIAPNLSIVNEQTPVADPQNDMESITADEAYYIMPSADHICGCACPCEVPLPYARENEGQSAQSNDDRVDGTQYRFSETNGPQENGSAASSTSVAASGDQGIDGLLSGVRWSGTSITYSDPDSVSDYQTGYPTAPLNGFEQISAQIMEVVHYSLDSQIYTQNAGASGFSVEAFTNLDISYAGSGAADGTIRVSRSSDPGTAYAYYPNNGSTGGDVFVGPSGANPVMGNYDWFTMMHEFGHSLGLAHGHTGGAYGPMPFDIDSMEFSIMTYKSYIGSDAQAVYNETWGYAQTFMMYDIAALQYMYGADFSSNSGNTVYSWNPTTGETLIDGVTAIDPGGNRVFATIWDGDGVDTYDLSNYTTDLSIDLSPGGFSVFSAVQLANLGGGPNGGFARGNIFNALQYQGDARSLIENAIGGSGDDSFVGNAANNTFTGNGGTDTVSFANAADAVTADLNAGTAIGLSIGSDTLVSIENVSGSDFDDSLTGTSAVNVILAGLGDDTLTGGGGDDTLNGGIGSDTAVFAGVEANYTVLDNADGTLTITDTVGQDGIDLLVSVEFATFADGTVALPAASGGATDLTNNDDNYTGTSDDDIINALDGNDIVDGAEGDDTINGGMGDDTLDGGIGDDTLNGDEGNDTINGGVGNDTINGGISDDTIDGGLGNDTLTGGDGLDTVSFASFVATSGTQGVTFSGSV